MSGAFPPPVPAVPVGMGEIEVATPPVQLEIRGLGSCVAIALHDPGARVAGLAHVVIPRPLRRVAPGPAWAATDAVPALLERVARRGAIRRRIAASVAGGASLFSGLTRGFNVGEENARVVQAALARQGIPVVFRDLGGTEGRSVRLDPGTGRLDVFARYPQAAAGIARPPRERLPETERELASVLLHRAAAPLATVLERPVAVEDPSAYELTRPELREFLGGVGALLHAAVANLDSHAGSPLALILPQAHAETLGRAVGACSASEAPEGDVLAEATSLMLSHAATAMARLTGSRILPGPLRTLRGTAGTIAPLVSHGAAGDLVLVLHGRLHSEGAARGVDVALVIPAGALSLGPSQGGTEPAGGP